MSQVDIPFELLEKMASQNVLLDLGPRKYFGRDLIFVHEVQPDTSVQTSFYCLEQDWTYTEAGHIANHLASMKAANETLARQNIEKQQEIDRLLTAATESQQSIASLRECVDVTAVMIDQIDEMLKPYWNENRNTTLASLIGEHQLRTAALQEVQAELKELKRAKSTGLDDISDDGKVPCGIDGCTVTAVEGQGLRAHRRSAHEEWWNMQKSLPDGDPSKVDRGGRLPQMSA
jgi:hypothetical protein